MNDTKYNVPTDWSTHLTHGTRRYVLADSYRLLRSDDSGETWMPTGATDFMHQQATDSWTAAKARSFQKYGSRMPDRSVLWHPVFAAYALLYFVICFLVLRKEGVLRAAWLGTRGLFVLAIVWALLSGGHSVFFDYIHKSFTYAGPTAKLGVLMNIGARPLPLILYLFGIWAILPGSYEVMNNRFQETGQKKPLTLFLLAGMLAILLHVGFFFIGRFFEHVY